MLDLDDFTLFWQALGNSALGSLGQMIRNTLIKMITANTLNKVIQDRLAIQLDHLKSDIFKQQDLPKQFINALAHDIRDQAKQLKALAQHFSSHQSTSRFVSHLRSLPAPQTEETALPPKMTTGLYYAVIPIAAPPTSSPQSLPPHFKSMNNQSAAPVFFKKFQRKEHLPFIIEDILAKEILLDYCKELKLLIEQQIFKIELENNIDRESMRNHKTLKKILELNETLNMINSFADDRPSTLAHPMILLEDQIQSLLTLPLISHKEKLTLLLQTGLNLISTWQSSTNVYGLAAGLRIIR